MTTAAAGGGSSRSLQRGRHRGSKRRPAERIAGIKRRFALTIDGSLDFLRAKEECRMNRFCYSSPGSSRCWELVASCPAAETNLPRPAMAGRLLLRERRLSRCFAMTSAAARAGRGRWSSLATSGKGSPAGGRERLRSKGANTIALPRGDRRTAWLRRGGRVWCAFCGAMPKAAGEAR